jgi:hypothetical protein
MTTPNTEPVETPAVGIPSQAYVMAWSVGPVRSCAMCAGRMTDEDVGARDGLDGCDDCLAYCNRCDVVCIRDETVNVTMHGTYGDCESWCEVCANEYAGTCGRCDESFPSSQLTRNRDYGYRMCSRCLEEVQDREEEEAEEEEREARDSGVIGEYHSRNRKSQIRAIHGTWSRMNGMRLFGAELEVEAPDMRWEEVNRIAGELLGTVNDQGVSGTVLFAEHDGSLSNGFELITQPVGLDRQADMWAKVLGHPSISRLRSHNTTTCGFHVHVSRTGLSQLTIAKAVVFLNDRRNLDLISAIARRYDSGYCKQKSVKLSRFTALDPDRYVMLNTLPCDTIEFRLFKGSTRFETLLGCIEFSNAVLNFCRDTTPADLTVLPFITWLHRPENRIDSKHLRALLLRRAAPLLGSFIPKANPRRVSATATSEE